MNRPDVVVLDLDGTVYPSGGPLTAAIDERTTRFLVEHAGLGPAEMEALEAGCPSILQALDQLELPRAAWQLRVHTDLPYDSLRTDPRLAAAMSALAAPTAVVTLAPAAHARTVLDAVGIGSYVDAIYSIFHTRDGDKRRTYQRLLGEVGAGALVAGDNPIIDLEPAQALGCHCVLIDETRLRPAGSFASYATLAEALEATLSSSPRDVHR